MPNLYIFNMLTRVFVRRSYIFHFNIFGTILRRNFSNDKKDDVILPGGGLDKLQGGIKEEKYFSQHDKDLITRIREQGSRLKCEDCLGNWAEFEKVLEARMEKTALQGTCSKNKHKNCMEEAFFLNEQNDSMKLFQDKHKLNDENNSLKISQITTDNKRQNSDNASDKENPPPIE